MSDDIDIDKQHVWRQPFRARRQTSQYQ